MKTSVNTSGSKAIIALDGRFDFSTHADFSGCYGSAIASAQVQEIEVDLAGVDYLDSSALGMLLLLSERAKIANKSVALSHPNALVAQVLERVSFGRIFTIR